MTSKVEAIWNAEVIVSRGSIDAPLFYTTSVSCTIENDKGGPVVTTYQMMEANAISWISRTENHDPESITIVALTWTEMEYTGADELPPATSP